MTDWTENELWWLPAREKYDCNLNKLAEEIAEWRRKIGFETSWENMSEKLMLVVTELSEAMEAYRDDDKTQFNEEIADVFIRLLDITGTLKLNIETAIKMKMLKNEKRPYKHGRNL